MEAVLFKIAYKLLNWDIPIISNFFAVRCMNLKAGIALSCEFNSGLLRFLR